MKYYNYLSLVTLFLVMGCNSENVDEEHHYDNKFRIGSVQCGYPSERTRSAPK